MTTFPESAACAGRRLRSYMPAFRPDSLRNLVATGSRHAAEEGVKLEMFTWCKILVCPHCMSVTFVTLTLCPKLSKFCE